jgi:hypothetical protein
VRLTIPIVEEELDNVLKKLKNNKAPGEDGLTLDLFNILQNYLIEVFQNF